MGLNLSKNISEDGFSSGETVGKLVLPATTFQVANLNSFNTTIIDQLRDKFSENNTIEYAKILQTDKKVEIPTVKIIPHPEKVACIIYCRGNGELMQYAGDELLRDKELAPNCGFIMFNYRGVADSSKINPKYYNHLVDDLSAVIEEAHKMGYDYSQIIIKGHSLGSAIASVTAAKYHAQQKPVYLFNGRSFGDINMVVAKAGGFFHSTVKTATSLTGWNIPAGSAYNRIPEDYKTFITAKNDEVINMEASIYRSYHYNLNMQLVELKLKLKKEKGEQSNILKNEIASLENKINHLASDHMLEGSHNISIHRLKREDGKTGDDVFHEFVQHAIAHRLQVEAKNQVGKDEVVTVYGASMQNKM